MFKLTVQTILQTLLWTVVAGVAYPLFITLIAQLAFHDQANGSLVERDGQLVGSVFLGQQFQGDKYFWSRPSAGTPAYGTSPSGASNLGPTSAALQTNVLANATALRTAHHLAADAPVPADLVFTSGSGVDPDISPEAARFQIARVAAARGMSVDRVTALVDQYIEPSQWGFIGEPRVKVLLLNLSLDKLDKK